MSNKELTVAEAGRLGGKQCSINQRAKDPDYYRKIGAAGGRATQEKHGTDFYRKIGKKGANVKALSEAGKAAAK